MSDYLTIEETAALLRVSPRTLRNKMSQGVLRLGEHYFRPRGLGPRFKRAALVAWLEAVDTVRERSGLLDDVPMSRQRLTRSEARG